MSPDAIWSLEGEKKLIRITLIPNSKYGNRQDKQVLKSAPFYKPWQKHFLKSEENICECLFKNYGRVLTSLEELLETLLRYSI